MSSPMKHTQPITPTTLGERIKSARITRGLTQEELARILGVSVMTVSRWERDYHVPDPSQADRLTRALGAVA